MQISDWPSLIRSLSPKCDPRSTSAMNVNRNTIVKLIHFVNEDNIILK